MKKRIQILICIFMLFSLSIVAFLIHKAENKVVFPIEISLDYGSDNIDLHFWEDDLSNTFCVFLPSFFDAKNAKWKIQTDKYVSIVNGNISICDGNSLEDTGYSDEMYFQCEKANGLYDTFHIRILKSENVDTIVLNTSSGSMKGVYSNKKHKEIVRMRTVNKLGNIEFDCLDFTIKGHGNSTWHRSKKAFELSTLEEMPVLGMGSSTKWVLLANAFDSSNLQDQVVFEVARELGLEATTPESRYVDLVIDGEYFGLYLLTQEPEHKVINSSEGIEMLFSLGLKERYSSMKQPVDIPNGGYLADLVYPDKMDGSAILRYAEKINSLDAAINELNADGPIPDCIDVDSWAKKYLIDEVFENFDSNLYSAYYYTKKDEGKNSIFFSGVIWDYDQCMVTVSVTSNPECIYAGQERRSDSEKIAWYNKLMSNNEFKTYVISLYKNEMFPILMHMIDERINAIKADIEQAALCNQVRWKHKNSISSCTEEIVNFLKKRIDFLDDLWLKDRSYCVVTVDNNNIDRWLRYYYVEPGTTLSQLEDDKFLKKAYSYYDRLTKDDIDFDTPICTDVHISARYDYRPLPIVGKFINDKDDIKMYVCICSLIGIFTLGGVLLICNIRRIRK